MSPPAPISTPRLTLLPATRVAVEAELAGREALALALGVQVPGEWPPELYDVDAIRLSLELLGDSRNREWALSYVIRREPRPVLIGIAGYKGAPDLAGTVEIGYSVLGRFQGQGLATEAVRALLDQAARHPAVQRVIAETLPSLAPSIRLLERLGFLPAGEGSGAGILRFALPLQSPAAALRAAPDREDG